MKWTRIKEKRVLTWPARLIILGLVLLLFYVFMSLLPWFLSPVKPVLNADLLIVEGFVHDNIIDSAIRMYDEDGYRQIITSGPVMDLGAMLTNYTSTAEVAEATFLKKGFPKDKITAVFAPYSLRQRTYRSALAVRYFVDSLKTKPTGINILTQGAHGRRSYFLFRKAFKGSGIPIGVISLDGLRYDEKKWWNTSKGARTVMSEFMGWFYEVLFFSPIESSKHKT